MKVQLVGKQSVQTIWATVEDLVRSHLEEAEEVLTKQDHLREEVTEQLLQLMAKSSLLVVEEGEDQFGED